MDIATKKRLLTECVERVNNRLEEINAAIEQAQEAITNETKSSAGDKYETSREMIQQDFNRYHTQLLQSKRDWIALQQLSTEHKEMVDVGAVVVTEKMTYFIAVSLGQHTFEGKDLMVISPSSPIGKLFQDRRAGESISFNGVQHVIQAIY